MQPSIPPQVRDFLTRHNLSALEFEPGSTATAPMAAAQIGCQVGQIAKSILFRDKKGSFHLVVLAGGAKVSSGRLKRLVGSETSMATPEEAVRVTGFAVGGVCPFGLPPGLPVWVDASLKAWDVIYPAAGNDASAVPIAYAALVKIIGADECDVASVVASDPFP